MNCAIRSRLLRLTVELMRRDNNVGDAAGDLQLIDQQVANLARLVDDLLDVTRMRQGKINLLKVPIDLRDCRRISDSVDQSRCRRRNGSRCRWTCPDESVYVDGDAPGSSRPLVNLLDNAMKYTDTGGRIAVSLDADATQVVLRVQGYGHRHTAGDAAVHFRPFRPGRKLADSLAWWPRNRVVHGGEARRDARRRC